MTSKRVDHPAFPVSPGEPSANTETGLSILAVANILLRQRALILACATIVVAAALTVSLLLPRYYRARVSFHPFEQRQTTGLNGLAAQFGLSVPTLDASRSSAFYAALIESETILGPVVRAMYDSAGTARSLVEAYDLRGESEAVREAKAIRRLRRRLDVAVAARTGIVTVDVDDRSASRARDIASNIITEVNRFNSESTRSRASAEREFSAQRVEEARKRVNELEALLRDFYLENRAWDGSPDLTFQHGQLQRELGLAQQLYAALVQGYEQARIDEIRNVPAISLVELPRQPAEPNSRRLIVRTVGGFLLGISLGVLLAFLREYLRGSAATGSVEYRELRQHMKDLPRKLLLP